MCNATQIAKDKDNKKEISTKQRYRVLAVYTKSHNKQFMTAEKQRWSREMNADDLKKYQCAIRIITDGYVDDYDNVDLNASNFRLKDVVRVI